MKRAAVVVIRSVNPYISARRMIECIIQSRITQKLYDWIICRRAVTPRRSNIDFVAANVLATNPSASALLRFQYNNRIITPSSSNRRSSSAAQASPAAPPPTITTEASARSQPGRLAFFMTWTKKQRNQLPTSKRNQMNTLLFLARSLSLSLSFSHHYARSLALLAPSKCIGAGNAYSIFTQYASSSSSSFMMKIAIDRN